MERLVKLSLLLISVFFVSFSLTTLVVETTSDPPAGALVWEECPYRGVKVYQGGSASIDVLDKICISDEINVKLSKDELILADWYNAPQEENFDIESIELIVKMKGCKPGCGSVTCNLEYNKVDIWVWNEDYSVWKKLETAYVKDYGNYTFDATDWITPNGSGVYKAKIENLGWPNKTRCLWVDYVGLKVVYYEMGEVKIWNSLTIDPLEIPKYSSFNVMGEVTCIGGECYNVSAYLKYSYHEYETYYNIPSSGTPMNTSDSNPYYCGYMEHRETCYPSWEVFGTKSGSYYLKMFTVGKTGNWSYSDNETRAILVSINPGVLYLTGSISSNEMNLTDDPLEVKGTVTCGTAPCGNVKIIAKYSKSNPGNFEVIGTSGNLSTGNDNPQDCGSMNPGDSCTKSWYVYGNEPGYYYIRLVAYSDDEDVESDVSDLNLKVNSEITVGILSITNIGVSPDKINVSEDTILSGTVSCSQEYCGDVYVYARSGGQKITSNGLNTSENPKICSGMQDGGPPCSVSWNIVGNDAGMYYLDILADSDQIDVENTTSSVVYLEVRNPVGSLYFPFEPEFGPGTIELYDIASLYAVVECDSSYCGKVKALVRYDSTNLSSSGDLKTQNQNPQYCESYPCDFSWNINGSKSGPYDITLVVTSNESSEELFRSYSLTVLDPNKPSLSIILGDLQDQYELGKTFTLKGEVRCDNGDCGEVKVYAKYKESEGDPWVHLTQTTPLSTSENPKILNLGSGESEWVEWTVNSSVTGSYILGISADANDTNVIDSGTSSRGIEVSKGADIGIDIQSPARGKTLSRGDEFLIKVEVTEGGYPMVGAFVTASSEGFFPAMQLNESDDGIYSKKVMVANTISKGSYIITVFVKRDSQIFSETTNVYVNPELEVSLDTDKKDYEILDKVKLQGRVLKSGKPVKASIELKLVCPSRSFKEILLETDSSGNYFHEYLISMATPAEVCKFELNTEDEDKNYNFTFKDVRIFPSEREVYKIDFLSPSPNSKYKKGDSVRIRIKVLYGDDPLEGASVLCINPMLEENIELNDAGDGVYDGEYLIAKEAPSDLWILTCIAKTEDEYFGRKSLNVYITPLELKLTEISPSATDFFQPGDAAKIRLRLTYPDNKPFTNASVYLKIGSETIHLNETGPGIYEGDYDVKSQGVFTFDVHAEDSFGNTGLFSSGVVITSGFAPFNLLWFVLPFVIAVALLAGVVWKRGKKEIIIKEEIPTKPIDRKRELENRIAELERKRGNIQKSKDVVEQEYYERKIDEKTFNKMIQNYEQEIISLNVEIEDLKRELAKL